MQPNDDASAIGHRQRGDRDVGLALQVEVDHLLQVHPIDVIGAEHQHEIRDRAGG